MNSYRIEFSDIEGAVGKVVYLHDGKDLGSGAFDIRSFATLRVLLPRYVGAWRVVAEVFSEDISNKCLSAVGECTSFGDGVDAFDCPIDLTALGVGLYFVRFRIESIAGTVYGYKHKTELRLAKYANIPDFFQLSACDFKYKQSREYLGGIIYHVFVDRFCKAGRVKCRADAVMMKEWEGGTPEYPEYPGAHLENNTFFGGTLYGVIEKLDYIKSLGANLIYLSPIFEAYSNHKYDTGNYMKVDDMFGGDKALVKLIEEARDRGIGIILDGVFNHTGSDSIYFNSKGRYKSLGAYQSMDSEFYSWYDFKSYPDDYTSWWGIKILPRIHPDNPACGEYIAGDGGVIDKYSKMGVAGFRLDVADELSDSFLEKIKERLDKNLDSSILYGEVWEDGSNKIAYDTRKKYYLGKELDGVMNYPVRVGIIDYLKNKAPEKLEYALTDVTFNAPVRVRNIQMNLLGTHDTERIITMLAYGSYEGKTNEELSRTFLSDEQRARGIALVKTAYAILATIPGIPAIFYGDEVALEGFKDPFNRRPYPWKTGSAELHSYYQALGAIRRENSVYKEGEFSLLRIDSEILMFTRSLGKKTLLTVVNNTSKDKTIEFDIKVRELISDRLAISHRLAAESALIIDVSKADLYEII